MLDPNELETEIRNLEHWQQVAFSAALTERMFNNFALFSKLMEFGDLNRMRTLLDGVWGELAQNGSKLNYDVQLGHVDDNMVDLDEFDTFGAIPARDAMLALYSTLICKLEKEASDAVAVSNLSYETVSAYIEFAEADDQMSDEELIRMINSHDMMLDEDAFQSEVLEQLKGAKQNAATISALRELGENQGISNIGISDEE
ncbi:MAG: DUF416 family protein [Marinobacterium sp.]